MAPGSESERSELHVTVATVTYNSARVIPGFLESLGRGLAGVDFDLVVVDNSSSDDSVGLVRRLAPDATVIETGANRGYAAGMNAAIAVAPDAVLVVNPDIRLDHGCGARLAAALEDPAVGIVAPRVADEHGAILWSLRRDLTLLRGLGEALLGGTHARRFSPLSQTIGDPSSYEVAHDVDWASGALLLVSRTCLATCGPWDEAFFLYCEEEEYQQRARRNGFRVRFTPDARAVHLGGDMHRSPILWALGMVNKLRLYARDHGRLATFTLRVVLVVNELLRITSAPHRVGLRALVSRSALTPGVRP